MNGNNVEVSYISLRRRFLYWFPVFKFCDVSQTLEGDEKPVHGKERQRGRGKQVENCKVCKSVFICFLIAMLAPHQSLSFKDPKCKFVL